MGAKMPVLLCLMFFSSKLDLTTPEALLNVRVFFGVVQTICLCVGLAIYRKIRLAADDTEIKYTDTKVGQDPVQIEQTIEQYDLEQIKKFLQQIVMGSAIVGFIHYKWGSTQPLLFQGVINPMNLFDMPLLWIHLLGRKAEGALQRPFKVDENPFAKMMENYNDNAKEFKRDQQAAKQDRLYKEKKEARKLEKTGGASVTLGGKKDK